MATGAPMLADLDYGLPEASIAQTPIEPRDAARLLVDAGSGRAPWHRHVRDLPDLVGPGDLLVLNETRVLAARLRLRKASGGAVDVLLLEPTDESGAPGAPGRPGGLAGRTWRALVRPSRRVPEGTTLVTEDGAPVVEIGAALAGGDRQVRMLAPVADVLSRHGQVPLPPYVRTALPDPDRYQTVYAARPGSVAAPTAGLHLTAEVLHRCRAAGAEIARVDLAVGLDTFRPITTPRPEDHPIHAERFRVPVATLDACRRAHRVLAVGTTTVRALETAARAPVAGGVTTIEGRTRLFIHGDFEFLVVDALLTNFHLPRSSLLLLVDAFIGPRWRELYRLALAEGYRFLSFGDALLLERGGGRR